MDSLFNVVFTGELKPGTEREAFLKGFSARFKCTEEKAAEVLDAGKPVNMKTSVTSEVGEQFRQVLEQLGMTIELVPLDASAEKAPAAAASPPAEDGSTNPYEAPKANLNQTSADGEMSGPVSVPFGHGSSWVSDAFNNHFKASPGAWIATFLVFLVLSIVMQIIPLIGPIAMALLSPVFTAGFMIGSRAQDEGENFSLNHLFSGFKQSTGQLVLVGLLYLVGTFVIGILAGALMGGSMAMTGAMSGNDPAAAQALMQNPNMFLIPMLVMMVLFIPLLMAYWFAPALVALDGVSALAAMKLSFSGCMKNMLPLTLYGIVMMVLAALAVIPLGLGLLVLFPVMMASMYTAYRDIFYPQA